MKKKLSEVEKMLLLSTAFTLVLVGTRYLVTNENVYLFYPWNLFLATVPLFFSRQLKQHKKLNFKVVVILACWLLFFPNAPYLLTDLLHYQQRPPVPYWFDLLIAASGAWNGVALGFVSLMQVERFLARHLKIKWRNPATVALIVLCSYGIFLGRFLRFNSWDVVTNPGGLIHVTISHFFQPWQHQQFWVFTFSLAAFLCIIYFTIKKLPGMVKAL